MKKIITLILFLITVSGFSQTIDTTNWSFKSSDADGKYRQLINRNIYQGKAAGTIILPIAVTVTTAPDTSLWSFVGSSADGTFRTMKNRSTYYGKSAGTVFVNMFYVANYGDTVTINTVQPFNAYGYIYNQSDSLNAANIARTNTANTYTQFQQLQRSIDTVGWANGNTASVSQSGQTCKVLCTSVSIGALVHGTLSITNINITGSSIIILSQIGYTVAGDIDADAVELGWQITGTGTMDIYIDPTIGSGLTNNFWIAYTIN